MTFESSYCLYKISQKVEIFGRGIVCFPNIAYLLSRSGLSPMIPVLRSEPNSLARPWLYWHSLSILSVVLHSPKLWGFLCCSGLKNSMRSSRSILKILELSTCLLSGRNCFRFGVLKLLSSSLFNDR